MGTMTEIQYTCRFCKTERTFEADISDLSVAGVKVNLRTWLDNLCCVRCGDYQKARSRIRDRMLSTAYFLIRARQGGTKSLPDIESACKAKFERLARDLNALVAAHHFREDLYDDQCGEAYFKHPEKVNLCMRIQTNALLGQTEKEMV